MAETCSGCSHPPHRGEPCRKDRGWGFDEQICGCRVDGPPQPAPPPARVETFSLSGVHADGSETPIPQHPPSRPEWMLEKARLIIKRMEERKDEDIHAWALRLAEDICHADD
jgi:hypothetical protein